MEKEITLRSIAGYCTEETLWVLMEDLCNVAKADHCMMTPDSIVIDGNNFLVKEHEKPSVDFLAPEYNEEKRSTSACLVWSIGANVYYASSGHVLFGGRGGGYQQKHPAAPLPVLQKAHRGLTPVIQRCLRANPFDRISLEELQEVAKSGLDECRRKGRTSVPAKTRDLEIKSTVDNNWPEEMIEI